MAVGDALLTAILGYGVVFLGLVLLMVVVIIVGKIMVTKSKKSSSETPATPAADVRPASADIETAPGSAGGIKLYDTPERDAAMAMAIVADKMGKPINEIRFISIKEVK